MRTTFETYFTSIYDGTIPACQELKKESETLLEQFMNPGEFHFDAEIAARHVDFMETFCYVPAGDIGKKLKFEPFQRAILEATFGFVDDDDLRQYQEVLEVVGRKNGKTTKAAAIGTDLLVNDNEGAPEIYFVATKFDQAKKGFTAAINMRLQSPMLLKHLKKRASDIYNPLNMGFMKPVASNTATLDSLDSHAVILDELAAIKNRDLYDLMKQSFSARKQPLLFCITTNGFVRMGIFDAQMEYAKGVIDGSIKDKRFLPIIYKLDDPSEWDKPECWIKANPGLGSIKKTETLAGYVQKAKDDPSFKPTVLVKDFNLPQTSESAWLRWEDLYNEAMWSDYIAEGYQFKYGIGSFDAADSVDLTSAKILYARPDDPNLYFESMYWIPESVIEEQNKRGDRKERDNVPYSLWVTQGYLRTCPGLKVEKEVILEWFKEIRDTKGIYIPYIFYDRWHIDDSLERKFRSEFGRNSMNPVRQGVISLSEPMKNLQTEFREKRIIYNRNPIDMWCLANTEAKADVNANIQPVKTVTSSKRIDGAVTFIMAYKGFCDVKDRYIKLNKREKE